MQTISWTGRSKIVFSWHLNHFRNLISPQCTWDWECCPRLVCNRVFGDCRIRWLDEKLHLSFKFFIRFLWCDYFILLASTINWLRILKLRFPGGLKSILDFYFKKSSKFVMPKHNVQGKCKQKINFVNHQFNVFVYCL